MSELMGGVDRLADFTRDVQYTRQGVPIVDEQGRLVGIITRDDVLRSLNQDTDVERSVLEAAKRDVIVTYPDELLQDAVGKMLRLELERLLVVSPGAPHHLVGYLGRSEVLSAHMRQLEEVHRREPGWFRRASNPAEQPAHSRGRF
jgi:CBS domain-containing protein